MRAIVVKPECAGACLAGDHGGCQCVTDRIAELEDALDRIARFDEFQGMPIAPAENPTTQALLDKGWEAK